MTDRPEDVHVLLTVTREVPAERLPEYARAWSRMAAAAARAGAHAWRFRSGDRSAPQRYLEFVEWRAGQEDPTTTALLATALAQLDAGWPGERSTWHEVRDESSEEGLP